MSEPQLVDGVIETVITDEALHLAHEAAEPLIDEVVTPAISKSAQAAYLRAKKASVTQNVRAGGIVAELRKKRKHTSIDETVSDICVQKSIFDYVP